MSGRHLASSDGRLHVRAASALARVSSRVLPTIPTEHLQNDLQELSRQHRRGMRFSHRNQPSSAVVDAPTADYNAHGDLEKDGMLSQTGMTFVPFFDGMLRNRGEASGTPAPTGDCGLAKRQPQTSDPFDDRFFCMGGRFQPVTHRPGRKLLICLNFQNGYRPAAVNRSGENGGRENAGGGERSSASQQVSAPNRAVPGDFRGRTGTGECSSWRRWRREQDSSSWYPCCSAIFSSSGGNIAPFEHLVLGTTALPTSEVTCSKSGSANRRSHFRSTVACRPEMPNLRSGAG